MPDCQTTPFVASSWFLFYLLVKDARSFEHKEEMYV